MFVTVPVISVDNCHPYAIRCLLDFILNILRHLNNKAQTDEPLCLYSLAWHRVSVQASLPERREGEGQESPGEGHGAQGTPHLLTLAA